MAQAAVQDEPWEGQAVPEPRGSRPFGAPRNNLLAGLPRSPASACLVLISAALCFLHLESLCRRGHETPAPKTPGQGFPWDCRASPP